MINYKELGFKCGLEIHQRVNTAKLFCNCYSDPNKELSEATTEIKRGLRAMVGETGTVDVAAAAQAKSGRTFKYISGSQTSCMVETDEEPPHAINQAAFATALRVAKHLECKIPQEVHVMRKTIVDGSATSGFQRTALVGIDGQLEVNGKKIGVQTVCIEEESSGIVARGDSGTEYRLDRLGIPLIEIATDASIASASEAKQVALALGGLLRNTGMVQRGLGTIRQDVNISIRGGARVEIKGAQEMDLFETMIENEVKRQLELIKLTNELKKNKAKVHDLVEITTLLTGTSCKFVAGALAKGGKVYAARLEGYAGKLKQELGAEGQRLGRELGDYAKLAGAGGIMHSDENLTGYGFTEVEVEKIKNKLAATNASDAFVMCADLPTRAENAMQLVLKRARLALTTEGVVPETRRAEGSITRFMRPLAGAARMYPETDIRVVEVNDKLVKSLEPIKTSTDLASELISDFGLSEDAAKRLAGEENGKVFVEVASAVAGGKEVNAKIANTLLQTLVSLRRSGVHVEEITPGHLIEVFKQYKQNAITGVAIEELLIEFAKRKTTPSTISTIIAECKLERFDKKQIAKLLTANGGNFGELMKLYRKNIDATEAQEVLKGLKTK